MKGEMNNFPEHFVDPQEKKSLKYGRQVAEAIWSRYISDNTWIGISDRDLIRTNRDYSAGRQSLDPYKQQIYQAKDVSELKNSNRKAYVNIDYGIVSVAPKIREVVLGMLEEIDHDVVVESIDSNSTRQRDMKKYREFIGNKLEGVADALQERNGVQVPRAKYDIKNVIDLQMYEMVGGFSLGHEIALEELCQTIDRDSRWPELRRKLLRDIYENNRACVRSEFDVRKGRMVKKYVDLEYSVLGYGGNDVESRIPYGGHIEEMTIGEVAGRLEANGYGEREIRSIVKYAMKSHLNKESNNRDLKYWMNKRPDQQKPRYYDMVIEVLCFDWITVDQSYKTLRKDTEGNTKYHPDTFGKEKYTDKRQTKVIDSEMLYEGMWIVGTHCMLDWGVSNFMLRPSKKEVRSSYEYIELPGASKVERIRPLIDSMQLSIMKLQIAKMAAKPKGMAIDLNGLANINLGDGLVTPKQLLRISNQTGSHYFRSYTLHNKVVNSSGPFAELEGGIGKQLQEWTQCWSDDYMRILEMVGLTQTAAASPDSTGERTYGAEQMAMDQTNHAMKLLYEAMTTLKERSSQSAAKRAITSMKIDKEVKESYTDIIGRNSVEAILSASDISLEDLGIKMIAQPNQHQKNTILQAANEALKVGKNGEPLIDYSDFFWIERALDQGKIKQCQAFLSYRTNERNKEIERKQQENIKLQNEELRKTEETKAQAKQMELDAKAKYEISVVKAKGEQDRETEKIKHKNRLEELQKEGELQAKYGVEVKGNF